MSVAAFEFGPSSALKLSLLPMESVAAHSAPTAEATHAPLSTSSHSKSIKASHGDLSDASIPLKVSASALLEDEQPIVVSI